MKKKKNTILSLKCWTHQDKDKDQAFNDKDDDLKLVLKSP